MTGTGTGGPPGGHSLTASLRPAALDARRGVVRLHPEVLRELGLRAGDPVRLTGWRSSAAIVAAAGSGESRRLLYTDDLVLGNLGVRDGGEVTWPATRGPRRCSRSWRWRPTRPG